MGWDSAITYNPRVVVTYEEKQAYQKLIDIHGVGEKTARTLVDVFGDFESVMSASVDELFTATAVTDEMDRFRKSSVEAIVSEQEKSEICRMDSYKPPLF